MRRFICVIASLLLVTVAACGTGKNVPAAAAVEKHQIKVGIVPSVGVAPVLLAKDSGMFADEGIDVEFVPIQSSGTGLPSLANGELDIVYGNYVSFFAEQIKGTVSVKFVADGYYAKPRTLMIIVPRDSKLTGPAALAGKRVAVTAANGLTGLVVRSVLDSAGGTAPPSYVEMPYSDMGAALQRHAVDAALLTEPYITDVAKKAGAYPLVDAAAGPTAEIPVSGYAATDAFIARYPNTVAAFQRALSKGASIAGNDRTQVERVVHAYAGVDEQTAALMALVGYPIRMNAQRLQRVPDLMARFGLLSQRIEARTMILPSAMNVE